MRVAAAVLLISVLQSQEPDPHPGRLRYAANPRTAHGGWVADPARHLSQTTVDSIDALIGALERETSAEIAVVVLDSLDNLSVDQAALTLHRRWGVGKRAHDNGIVLLWSPARREISVSVGYGLEGNIPDARAGRIQDQHMIPRFARQEFDAGVLAGVRALIEAAREDPRSRTRPGAQAAGDGARGAVALHSGSERRPPTAVWIGVGVGALLLALGLGVGWRHRRHRPRPCPNGHGMMRLIRNDEDEPYLGTAEAVEERIGSIDYDVWVCDACDARLAVPHRALFTRYAKCPKCSRRTLLQEQQTLRAATMASGGLVDVRQHCESCGHRHTEQRATPRLPPPSSASSGSSSTSGSRSSHSSSSRSSSFGGGSAGGGGASRKY